MIEGKPEVLIIDDDPGILFLHDLIVKESKLNPHPRSFLDASEALDYLLPLDARTSKFLIFLDINMPLINGWKFLDLLGEKIKWADIKVVMVTSSLSRSEREKSKEYSLVIDFWEKPIDEEKVIGLMDKLGQWLN